MVQAVVVPRALKCKHLSPVVNALLCATASPPPDEEIEDPYKLAEQGIFDIQACKAARLPKAEARKLKERARNRALELAAMERTDVLATPAQGVIDKKSAMDVGQTKTASQVAKEKLFRTAMDEGIFEEAEAKALQLSRGEIAKLRALARKKAAALEREREAEIERKERQERIEKHRFLGRRQIAVSLTGDSGADHQRTLKDNPPSWEFIERFQAQQIIPTYDLRRVRDILFSKHEDLQYVHDSLLRFRLIAAKLLNKSPDVVEPSEIAAVGCWFVGQQELETETPIKWQGFRHFWFRCADEHDPYLNDYGLVDRARVPDDLGVIYLKGLGELVVPKSWASQEKFFQDMWARERWNYMPPIDTRTNANELNPAANSSGLTRILSIAEKVFKKALEAQTPSEEDVDYGFKLEDEQPFAGSRAVFTKRQKEAAEKAFVLPKGIAKIHNNVIPSYRLRPCARRQRIYEEFLKILAQRRNLLVKPWSDIQRDANVAVG